MSKHALPRDQLAKRLARIGLAAAFAVVEMLAAFAVGWTWLGIALPIMAGWNVGLVLTGLLSLRDEAPRSGGSSWGGTGGMPR